MKNFDERIKDELNQEDIQIPNEVHTRVEETLNSLSEKEERRKKTSFRVIRKKVLTLAASFAFVFIAFLPNVSITYAQVVSEIPVIGAIVNVFTIRNYTFTDERHELDAEIPNVEVTDGKEEILTDMNADIDDFTTKIIEKFYEDMQTEEGVAYNAVNMDYEVVTNSDSWFTLKINVTETQVSGYMYAKFYHINRETGEYVTFTDLFDTSNYAVLEEYIISDMKAQMEMDENIVFFFDDPTIEEEITYVSDKQNFYFDENHNLVMVYNEYEVAPGYMGMPEITIPVDVYEPLMK